MNFCQEEQAPDWIVELDEEGMRLDLWLARKYPGYSRTYFQNLIEEGLVLVNGLVERKKYSVCKLDEIEVEFRCQPQPQLIPQDIPLDVLYEDDHLLVINKPAGLVVHPGAGCPNGTIANALAFRLQQTVELLAGQAQSLRPGIVHRLDKDTSGVLLTAKTSFAHTKLVEAFSNRQVRKTYLAICCKNQPPARIEEPIERDPSHRQRMRAGFSGRGAVSLFETKATSANMNWPIHLLQVQLITGRTHQIRVHLKWAGCPILGDVTYGWPAWSAQFEAKRQFLHAWKLELAHPVTNELLHFCAPIASDMGKLINEAFLSPIEL